MLDQENDRRGLNSYFWEEWQYPNDDLPVFYFPLAGEFRLTRVPRSNGGLLCEEMGLGKTVEIISLILANPLPSTVHHERNDLPSIKTTLVVVPMTLVEQWWREFHTRVGNAADGTPDSFQVLNLSDLSLWRKMRINIDDIRYPADENHPHPSEWGCDFDGNRINHIDSNRPYDWFDWNRTVLPKLENVAEYGQVLEFRAPWIANDRVLLLQLVLT